MSYDRKKFKNAILYIARAGGDDVGMKKLAKILYFLDFTLQEKREKPLTKMRYVKQSYGPMPDPLIFYPALRELEDKHIIKIEKQKGKGLQKIIANQEPDLTIFDKEEKQMLTTLTEKYRLDNAGELERVAQSEAPYKMVANYGEEIPYHLAFYRNSFGEMDLNNEDSNT